MPRAGALSFRAWALSAPVFLVAIAVAIPIGYLLLRAFDANAVQFLSLLARQRNLVLLWNTVALGAVVLTAATAIGFGLAWLVERTDFLSSRILTVLGILPLAVPGYVMAYALLGSSGDYGLIARLSGTGIPSVSGFWGSALVLSLYTFPYMFLNLRSGFSGLDPALDESARTLGYTEQETLLHVTVPQLRPAFLAGSVLVLLHVLGDFGVVSLMRFETLSYAVYLQYAAAFDRTYAACLALILLALSAILLFAEFRLLKGRHFHQSWTSPRRSVKRHLGKGGRAAAASLLVLVGTLSVVLPISTILFWAVSGSGFLSSVVDAFAGSVSAALPAAGIAGAVALSVAYARIRFANRGTVMAERIAYLGYATPPLAFALAIIFFSINIIPFFYQTFVLLVGALAVHFLAEALGPIRTAIQQSSERLEEAARNLGRSGLQAFFHVTFPAIKNSVFAGTVLVFLSVMKELPMTLLLSPTGFRTLSVNVWMFTSEAQFGRAAPFALLIMLSSACFAAFALRHHDPIVTTEA